MTVIMKKITYSKIQFFWDVTLYRQANIAGRFGGLWRLHLQGQKVKEDSSLTVNPQDKGTKIPRSVVKY